MKNIKKLLVALVCVLMCVALFAGCGDNTETKESATPAPSTGTSVGVTEAPSIGTTGTETTPGPTPGNTPGQQVSDSIDDVEIVMKAGDVYKIFVWNNDEENKQVNGETGGARAKDIRQRWEDFQQEYGITITWVACTYGAAWLDGAATSIAAGEPVADIVHMGGPFAIPAFMSAGGTTFGQYYEDLNQYVQYTNLRNNDYWKQEAMQYMGASGDALYVAIPYGEGWGDVSTNQVTFFNSAITEENGYSADDLYELYQNGEWTFDKYREVALACTDADKNVYGTCVSENAMTMLALIHANNGDITAPNENGVPVFAADSANSMYAINFFLDMCKTDKSVHLEGTYSQAEANLFKKGEVALMITYANRVTAGEGPRKGAMYQMEGFEYGIILPPKGPNATDYRSDNNWASPLAVVKGHTNPKGVVQCMSYYMCGENAAGSVENNMLLESEASTYFADSRSVQTLKDAVAKSFTSSYMAYWSMNGADGMALASVTSYNFNAWLDGSITPEIDYASKKDAVNAIIGANYKND